MRPRSNIHQDVDDDDDDIRDDYVLNWGQAPVRTVPTWGWVAVRINCLLITLGIGRGFGFQFVSFFRCLLKLFMAALCNRAGHYIFVVWFFFFYLSSFSSPNLSRRRLNVYHTLAHGVALVRI